MMQTDDFEVDYSNSSNLSFNSIEEYKLYYSNNTVNKSQLKILQLNAQSIVNINRFEELKLLLHSIGSIIHVIIISETWLKSTETSYTTKFLTMNQYLHAETTRMVEELPFIFTTA